MANVKNPDAGPLFARLLTDEKTDPYDAVTWKTATAEIKDDKGNIVFRQEGVEFPEQFSQLAINVVTSKYFYGARERVGLSPSQGGREHSYRQLVSRVVDTITEWGYNDGVFRDPEQTIIFREELTAACLGQYGAFNSPVWFNVGLHQAYGIRGPANNWRWDTAQQRAIRCEDAYEYPMSSACFIQSLEDDMESIMDLAKSEAMLFKYGSGTGEDISVLRSKRERLSGGGHPSGPCSFLKIYDTIAGTIKSGGKTRRAARIQTLMDSHPDVLEFIQCKSIEEDKARALIREGYDASFNGEAYATIAYQNTNISVRLSDAFMTAAKVDAPWQTKAVTTGTAYNTMGEKMPEYKARTLLDEIAKSAWLCGDPGVQFHDTINRWNCVPNEGTITSTNPCAEFVFPSDSACNLASLRLTKFQDLDGRFDVNKFRHVVRLFITAQEILVSHGSYPTEKIATRSQRCRPLGLGYCDMGGFLMGKGVPYDSEKGRSLAGAITAILLGEAYAQSACLAARLGPFEAFDTNREPMLNVMSMHRQAAIDGAGAAGLSGLSGETSQLWDEAVRSWDETVELGRITGYRNAQTVVIAPTGSIGFLMDADTTGIEPDMGLVKYKTLAGGGMLRIVNKLVPKALRALGYDPDVIDDIVDYVDRNDTIEGSSLKPEHLPVFDCAYPSSESGRVLSWRSHINMLAAVQPFVSGSISKTVSVPADATPDDIYNIYFEGWKLGLKCLSIYRDNSKGSQPLSTKKTEDKPAVVAAPTPDEYHPQIVDLASQLVGLSPNGDLDWRRKLVEMLQARVANRDDQDECPRRRKLQRTRQAITHHFEMMGYGAYLTVGLYPDGRPGELFIEMAKEGSTLGGFADSLGILVSFLLQYGIPLEPICRKLMHTHFDPSGFTDDPVIRHASSPIDYIFHWLGLMFCDGIGTPDEKRRVREELGEPAVPVMIQQLQGRHNPEIKAPNGHDHAKLGQASLSYAKPSADQVHAAAPCCDVCGRLTRRMGKCFVCDTCGTTIGSCGG